MAKPPAGSSLLFGAIADSGRIKERNNGGYRMVLERVEEIDWFTDRPYRSEGLWKPQKLIRQWDSFFETSDPNAQASFKIGEKRELMTFEMFKPKYNNRKQRLSFAIDAGIINRREKDLIIGLKGKVINDVTLFIDDASVATSWVEQAVRGILNSSPQENGWNLTNFDLTGANLSQANLAYAMLDYTNFTNANLSYTTLANANLYGANMSGANLTGVRWDNTICPDGTNSNNNLNCGF